MELDLNIGFGGGPAPTNVICSTGKYGISGPAIGVVTTGGGGGTPTKDPRGIWTAINPEWQVAGVDSGTYKYLAGPAGSQFQISADLSKGTMPGGSTGIQKYGGSALILNTNFPVAFFDSTHRTVGVSFRYNWNQFEPTVSGNYIFAQSDADLAQCILRGVMYLPIIISKTFPGNAFGINPAPTYLNSISYPVTQDSHGDPSSYEMARWDTTLFKPHFANLAAALGNRYDTVANFLGIATQETSVGNLPSGTGYDPVQYANNLMAESDVITAACPTSYHWGYVNFLNSNWINYSDWLIDQVALHYQGNGAILFGPDGVNGGTLLTRSYPRFLAYSKGGKVIRASQTNANGTYAGGSTTFPGGGASGLGFQNAEWNSSMPAQANTPVQTALTFLTSGSNTQIDILMEDWHQLAGSPNGQKFQLDGVNLVKNNPTPLGLWTP